MPPGRKYRLELLWDRLILLIKHGPRQEDPDQGHEHSHQVYPNCLTIVEIEQIEEIKKQQEKDGYLGYRLHLEIDALFILKMPSM